MQEAQEDDDREVAEHLQVAARGVRQESSADKLLIF